MLNKLYRHVTFLLLVVAVSSCIAEANIPNLLGNDAGDIQQPFPVPPNPVVEYMAKSDLKKEKARIYTMLQKAPSVAEFLDALKQMKAEQTNHISSVSSDINDDIEGNVYIGGTPDEFFVKNFNSAKTMCTENSKSIKGAACTEVPTNESGEKLPNLAFDSVNLSSMLQKVSIASSKDSSIKELFKNVTGAFLAPVDVGSDKFKGADLAKKVVSRGLLAVPLNSLYAMYNIRRVATEGTLSTLANMERESTWRMENESWVTDLAVAPKEAVLREIAQIKAASLWMQYKQYQQMERLESLLAILTAKMITGSEMMDMGGSSISASDITSSIPGQGG